MSAYRCVFAALTVAGLAVAATPPAHAFCGFYVAKADAKLFNKASKVVVARKDDKTVVTMASDYQGDPKEFAMVIPVPTVVKQEQIHITDNALVDHLDAYTAPRLVEYHEPDPCSPVLAMQRMSAAGAPTQVASAPALSRPRADALGVKIEAEYTVGEYDILILSAKQSDGLETWLKESGYRIPDGASAVLASYLKQDMKFFVAKVNLKEQQKLGGKYLRPISVAYETRKFMLPVRLGTVNADGPQELFIFMLTEKGRVETTNYRSVRIPSNVNVPLFTRAEFPAFYKAMFDHQVKKDDMRAVYLEYAWNMGWCDPCAADPIPNDKLVELGAFWLARGNAPVQPQPGMTPGQFRAQMRPQNAFITRLHVRYDGTKFPEDLMFQETADSSNYQGRYVLTHPFRGEAKCDLGDAYRKSLPERFAREAKNLADLTGWDLATITDKMSKSGQPLTPASVTPDKVWYEQMWGKK